MQPFAGQEQLSEHDNYDDRGGQLRQYGGGESSQPVDGLGGGMRVGFDAARHAAQIHGEHHDHGGHQQRQTGPGQIAEVARAARSDVVDVRSGIVAVVGCRAVRSADSKTGRPAVTRGDRPVGSGGGRLVRAIFRSGLLLFSSHERLPDACPCSVQFAVWFVTQRSSVVDAMGSRASHRTYFSGRKRRAGWPHRCRWRGSEPSSERRFPGRRTAGR